MVSFLVEIKVRQNKNMNEQKEKPRPRPKRTFGMLKWSTFLLTLVQDYLAASGGQSG